ncbi:hypothetical protein [Nocardia niwae]|uniref:Uncharacterized protein n=1 Tax=Nocardia niwae TaxID=626084 RepID=A0ABV2XHJ7_9NOCA
MSGFELFGQPRASGLATPWSTLLAGSVSAASAIRPDAVRMVPIGSLCCTNEKSLHIRGGSEARSPGTANRPDSALELDGRPHQQRAGGAGGRLAPADQRQVDLVHEVDQHVVGRGRRAAHDEFVAEQNQGDGGDARMQRLGGYFPRAIARPSRVSHGAAASPD